MGSKRFYKTIFVIILLASTLSARNTFPDDLKIIQSNSSFILIEYTPVIADSSAVYINGKAHQKIVVPWTVYKVDGNGNGRLERSIMLGVPAEFGNTIEILESSFIDLPAVIAAHLNSDKNHEAIIRHTLETSKEDDAGIIRFAEYGYARNIPVQRIIITPAAYNSAEGKVRFYQKIVFRINFSGRRAAAPLAAAKSVSDDLLKDAIINYEASRSFAISEVAGKLGKGKINSVLSSGKWYRFEAPEEGIYRITQQTISSLGLNPQTTDPKTIRIFNNGGRALSEAVDSRKLEDLQENAVFVQKATDDGKFNSDDYVLFYGRGIHFWEYDTLQKSAVRYYHPYSKANYYFMTFSQGPSKRMQDKGTSAQTAQVIQQTTKAYASWEEAKYKLIKTGRRYLGEFFSSRQLSRTFRTNIAGCIKNSPVTYKLNFVNRSETRADISIEENTKKILEFSIEGLGPGGLEPEIGYYGIEKTVSCKYAGDFDEGSSLLRINYKPNSEDSYTYLNYFEISYTRQMNATGDQLVFYSPDTTAAVEYRMTGFSNSNFTVFDISDPLNVKIVGSAKISGGDCTFTAQEREKNLSKYMAANSAVFKAPVRFEALTNSNLHGMEDEGKLIVITHRNFLDQAKRLEQHKESLSDKVTTVVVAVQDIFNEFSGGLQDVSGIRDFIKYAYDNWTVKPEYVLLFGDGDYDYKDIAAKHINFVIPYESYESWHNIYSYATDDYYASVSGNDFIVDLALGRINVNTLSEAETAVDKIIKYETKMEAGPWRNLITICADDSYMTSGRDYIEHTGQAELFSSLMDPSIDQNKLYAVFYPTEETSKGRRKPMLNKAIIDAFNAGTVLFSWIGHGAYNLWAHERIFEDATGIAAIENKNLSFLTAATCNFGFYDNPEEQCSTEKLILKKDAGLIGALAAARSVTPTENNLINNTFCVKLLSRNAINETATVGKAYYLTKIVTFRQNGINDLKFHLFGDPTIKLLMPRMNLSIDSVNGISSSEMVNVKALSKLRVSGSVRNADKTVNTQAGGEVLLTIYDSERTVPSSELNGFLVKFQGGIIYKGLSSVQGGRFTATFTVPKDISYENKPGKAEAYLQSGSSDALGYTKNIIIGGSDSLAVNDKKGPEMEIALDRIDGVNSVLVSPDFTLYVKLKDETGINTTGTGIGHRLEAVLNGNENAPIDLSGEFTGDMDSGGKSGLVRHHFTGMAAGSYRIKVKVWDVFNNPGEQEKTFTVTDSEGLVVRDLYNYPNPFKDRTTFSFQHNMNEAVNVMVKVYTVSGRMIRQIQANALSDRFVRLDWDGRDQDGNMVANGTYLYKMIVKSISDSYSRELIGKLAVIR